jgi:ATP-binding cassette subfamily F protein 3
VLLISHDPHLIETCADRLWLVARGRVTPFDGDMDDYRRLLLEERKPANGKTKAAPKASKAEERKAAAERRAQIAPLKRAVEAAEKKLGALNGELAKLEAALGSQDLHEKEPPRVIALTRQRAEVMKQIAAAEAQWLASAEAYETARAAVEDVG